MHNRTATLAATVALVTQAACTDFLVGSPKVTSASPHSAYQAQAVHWSKKPRIAVMEFEDKTGAGTQIRFAGGGVTASTPIGSGMKEQLVTALSQTNAFIILERQSLEDVVREQDLGQSGRLQRQTAARIGDLEGAELLVYGAVTEFEANQAGAVAGGGTGARFGRIMGGPLGEAMGIVAEKATIGFFNQDHVAIDIRLVDARTGRIVGATSVQGNPRDLGGVGGGIFGTTLLGVGGHYNTPTQKAVRACMIKAVNWIGESAMSEGLLRSSMAVASPPPSDPELMGAQRELIQRGFDCGGADGLMGPRTRACLKAYQASEGIAESGELDQATRARLGK
jgi:curli biogenesis system outer membrane secretion channel CsgG